MSQDDNSNEGADPTDDIKKQNPEGKIAGVDSGTDDHTDHKVQELTRAGRPGFDPNAGEE